MEPKASLRCFLVLAGSSLLHVSSAYAQSGNWNLNSNTNSNWSVAANWSPAAVPGNVAGDTVSFTNNINSNRTVTVDGTARTVGFLNIGDSNDSNTFTITTTAGLTFDNGSSAAQINEFGALQTDNIGAITLASDLAVSAGGSLRMTGVISETGGAKTITKTGTGALRLDGDNTYTGQTLVNNGTLQIGHNNALGTTAGNTSIADGSTVYAVVNTVTAVAEAFTINGSGVGGFGAIRTGGSANTTWSGAITLGSSARIGSDGGTTITLSGGIATAGHTLTLAPTGNSLSVTTNAISGAGGVASSGTVNMNVLNTYSGGTTVNSGTLTIGTAISGSNSAIGSTSGQLTVNGGTLNMAGNNMTVGNLNGLSGTISGTTGTRTLTIGQGSGTGGIFGGQITNGSGGTTSLTKTGNGTITLSGSNSYTGGTLVNGGTLALTSIGSVAGSVQVDSATLTIASGGTGRTFANNLVLNGSTVQSLQDNIGTGGNSITASQGNVRHTFTESGTLNLHSAVTSNQLIVGGGGGGGGGTSGVAFDGGGGGGRVINLTNQALAVGNTTVTVGAGGAGLGNGNADNGGASSIGTNTAAGGFGATVSPSTGRGGNSGSTLFTGGLKASGTGTAGGGGAGDSANGANAPASMRRIVN